MVPGGPEVKAWTMNASETQRNKHYEKSHESIMYKSLHFLKQSKAKIFNGYAAKILPFPLLPPLDAQVPQFFPFRSS